MRGFSVSTRWWDQTQLLQHAHLIDHDPTFNNLLVLKAHVDQPLRNDGLASGWVAEKQSRVGAAHCPLCRDSVALDDLILYAAVQIGKRRSEHGDPLFETHPVGGDSPTQMMADAVRRDQFIHNREIALVESFVKDSLDDGLALSG